MLQLKICLFLVNKAVFFCDRHMLMTLFIYWNSVIYMLVNDFFIIGTFEICFNCSNF